MPITLAEASVGRADKVTQEVIDTLRRGSLFMDELTFDDAVSPGVGGSTMTYGYLQLQTPSTAAGRAINSEYTANEAKKVKKTVDLKIFGGVAEVDRVIQEATTDEIAFQLEQKTKATKTTSSTLALMVQRLISRLILTVFPLCSRVQAQSTMQERTRRLLTFLPRHSLRATISQ